MLQRRDAVGLLLRRAARFGCQVRDVGTLGLDELRLSMIESAHRLLRWRVFALFLVLDKIRKLLVILRRALLLFGYIRLHRLAMIMLA